MGAFDQKPPAQEASPEQGGIPEGMMEIQSEDGTFTILVRVAVTPEDEQIIMNRYLTKLANSRKRLSIEQQAKLLDSLWLELLIQRWDLPISLENKAQAIARLSQSDREYLYKRIMAAQPEKPLREKTLSQRPLSRDIKGVIERRKQRFSNIV